MTLVKAYDTRTGQEHWVRDTVPGHPVIGQHLSLSPPSTRSSGAKNTRRTARAKTARKPSAAALKKADTKPAETTETPVAGEGKD